MANRLQFVILSLVFLSAAYFFLLPSKAEQAVLRALLPDKNGGNERSVPRSRERNNASKSTYMHKHEQQMFDRFLAKFAPKAGGKCATYPETHKVHYSSPNWQYMKLGNGTVNVYGAYYDDRQPSVKVAVFYDGDIWPTVYCQLWYTGQSDPVIVEGVVMYAWRLEWRNSFDERREPYIVACEAKKRPQAVSIVEEKCSAPVTALPVQYEKPKKKEKLAVCVKWVMFEKDISERMVEWLEFLKLMGVSAVYMHLLKVHPSVERVLNEYKEQGFLHITDYSFPPPKGFPPDILENYVKKGSAVWKDDMIPYIDCLYRNLYKYEYLIPLDIDEVIVPLVDNNWLEMLAKIDSKNYTSISARNIFYLDVLQREKEPDIPFGHMLKHTMRTDFTLPSYYEKSFQNTDSVLIPHNHFPIRCFKECLNYNLPTDTARLQHYRKDCEHHLPNKRCDGMKKKAVRDTAIWRWKDPLLERMRIISVKLSLI